MLTKRIIPCLDIKDGRTVKGIQFENLIDAGDPVLQAKAYAANGADELVFLDISATNEKRKTLIKLVEKIAQNIAIPFTVGGGITSQEDVHEILLAGADKITLNSAAVKQPKLIEKISQRFGNQCVVLAIDAKFHASDWFVYTNGGKEKQNITLYEWAKIAVDLGAGEILFTSMDHDGTKSGFAIEALDTLTQKVNVPIIASGGAGTIQHFAQLFEQTQVDAALAASVFHFGEINIFELKKTLSKLNIPVRI